MNRELERSAVREAIRIIRQRAIAERVARCIEAAAELHGCAPCEIVAKERPGRGAPAVARARVVAMHACVALGVPMLTTAKAFKRKRRTVHSALRIGRPGREQRDGEVLVAMRAVVARVRSGPPTAPFSRPQPLERPKAYDTENAKSTQGPPRHLSAYTGR